jgi:hypothetical protein
MASIISAGTTSGTALNMAGDTSGEFQIATNGSTTAITINTAQNVGIGTDSPSAKLNVVGSFGAFNRALLVTPSSESAAIDALRTIAIQRVSNDSQLAIGYATTPDAWVISSSYGSTGTYRPLAFATSDAERMRILSTGDIVFGKTALDTTNPGVWFETTSINYGRFNFIKGTASGTGATASLAFYYNGSQIGSIQNTSTATSYVTSSDYRLKENIAPMKGALDKVAQLKPVTYKWKVDGVDGQGFIAHELQAIVPDCVTGEKDAVDEEGNIKPQGIDTSFLVATLTAAIQEQQTIINDLKARITALEGAA